MTFDEWATAYGLDADEQRQCREYLVYLRSKKFIEDIFRFLQQGIGNRTNQPPKDKPPGDDTNDDPRH